VLNQIDPHFIRVRTFIPQPDTALFEAMREGRYQSPSPETILTETKVLLEGLCVTSQFLSDHVSNLLPLDGKLPEEREEMLRMIDDALERLKKDTQARAEMELRRHLTNL